MQLPKLAYIGHALLNYTIFNSANPAATRGGLSFYDTFTGGILSFHNSSVISLPAPVRIPETGPIPIRGASEPTTVKIISGGDYFTLFPNNQIALDSTAAAATMSGEVVYFKAGGYIRVDAVLAEILNGMGTRDMAFGETDFWEPITVVTAAKELAWLSTRVIFSQGRILVDPEKGKAYGFELRLWTPIN